MEEPEAPVAAEVYPENIVYSTVEEYDTIEPDANQKRRKANTLILQIIVGIVILFVIYLIFKFVVNYWKYILMAVILAAAFYGGWIYVKKKRRQ